MGRPTLRRPAWRWSRQRSTLTLPIPTAVPSHVQHTSSSLHPLPSPLISSSHHPPVSSPPHPHRSPPSLAGLLRHARLINPPRAIPPPAPSEPIWAARKPPHRPSAPPSAPPRTLFLPAPSTLAAAFQLGRAAPAPSAKAIALRAKVQLLATQCHLSSAVGESIADEWVDTEPALAATDLISSLRMSLKSRASSTIDLD